MYIPDQDKYDHDKWINTVLKGLFIALASIMLFGLLASCVQERDCTQQRAAYKHRKKVQKQLNYDTTVSKY